MKKKLISIFIILAIFIGSGTFFSIFVSNNIYCQNNDCMEDWEDQCILYNNSYYHDTPDGCTYVPDSYSTTLWGNEFTWYWESACNTHDICYMTLNSGKRNCDNAFEENLLNTYAWGIDDNGDNIKIRCGDNDDCRDRAEWYAWGVDGMIAEYVYNDSQEDQENFLNCIRQIDDNDINCRNW